MKTNRTRELLDLLPLYGAALAVTLCGIAAVNVTADYPNGSSLIVLLTVLGFGVSLAMRLLRVDPNQAMYPLIGFVLFVTLQRLLSGEGLIDMMIGTQATRPVLSQLSPFTAPILRKAQNFPSFNTAIQSSSSYLPVGSGPISLSETPVLEVRGARRTSLWRTRTFDHYTGRGWTASQPEDPRFPTLKGEATIEAPKGIEVDSQTRYYELDFEGDPHRTQAVT